jgi:flagellar basal-body rod modification protein FlgD
LTNTIDSSLLLSNYQESQKRTPSSTLGKDDFLKLLMTQLQNQDPSKPMEDTDFIAQMAQFSSLEQMTNMTSTFGKFIEQQQQSQMIAYNQFVGKEITWHKLNDLEDGTTEIEEGTGKITSIQFKDDLILFNLEDGNQLEPDNISQVNASTNESNIVQASMMIGKTVTFLNDTNQEISALIKSVSFKNGYTTFQLDDGVNTALKSSQIIKIE